MQKKKTQVKKNSKKFIDVGNFDINKFKKSFAKIELFKARHDIIESLLYKVVINKKIRKLFYKKLDDYIKKAIFEENPSLNNAIKQKKYEFVSSLLSRAIITIDKGYFSEEIAKKMINSLVFGGFLGQKESRNTREEYKKKYGENPPSFIVFSPTQMCNLKCTGCYAASSVKTHATLPYEVVDKVIGECYHKFGNRFCTISGGEPFLYKDKKTGKTLLDIFEKYNDMFFLVYTNGTCLTKDVIKRLVKSGNVTPAISVEGYEKETDERRGKGVYNRILLSFKNLREAGLPFGISVTATKKNVDLLLEDKFYKLYFDELGASYMWQFQLMPIGRAVDTSIMVTPRQRIKLYHKWKELTETKQYPIADFWNSGVLVDGCIAYGTNGGYFYINWDGNITPCAFVPYYIANVIDLYKKGKSLTDAVNSQFFKNGRAWQEKYKGLHSNKKSNLLMPCSIRDHYENFRKNIITKDAIPENNDSKLAISSPLYRKTLKDYDEELEKLTVPIWEKEYSSGKN